MHAVGQRRIRNCKPQTDGELQSEQKKLQMHTMPCNSFHFRKFYWILLLRRQTIFGSWVQWFSSKSAWWQTSQCSWRALEKFAKDTAATAVRAVRDYVASWPRQCSDFWPFHSKHSDLHMPSGPADMLDIYNGKNNETPAREPESFLKSAANCQSKPAFLSLLHLLVISRRRISFWNSFRPSFSQGRVTWTGALSQSTAKCCRTEHVKTLSVVLKSEH